MRVSVLSRAQVLGHQFGIWVNALLLRSVLTAVSDCLPSGGGEACYPLQVVGEPPKFGVEWDLVCPELATPFSVEGADLTNALRWFVLPNHTRTMVYLASESHLFLVIFFYIYCC